MANPARVWSPRPLVLLAALLAVGLAPLAFRPRPQAPPAAPDYDVIVVGNTPAAVAAALAAAERGMRVTVLSKEDVLGGDLSLAMLTQWDRSPSGVDPKSRYYRQFYAALPNGFDPQEAADYFHRLLAERRISWHSGLRFITPHVVAGDAAPRRIASVAYDSPAGTGHASATCFVDATQNADFAAAAGARYDVGRQGQGIDSRMQPAGLLFTLSGVNWKWLRPKGDQAAGFHWLIAQYRPLSAQVNVYDANFQLQRDGTVMVNAIDVLGIDGRDDRSLAMGRAIAVAEIPHFVAFLQDRMPGFKNARVAQVAPELMVRETRHVAGLTLVTGKDLWNGKWPLDTIARASYPIDVHPMGRDEIGGWKFAPQTYGIPLRAMLVRGFDDLAIAGPSISATHDAAGSLRMEPASIAEGEAAGTACALSVTHRATLVDVDLSPILLADLQHILSP